MPTSYVKHHIYIYIYIYVCIYILEESPTRSRPFINSIKGFPSIQTEFTFDHLTNDYQFDQHPEADSAGGMSKYNVAYLPNTGISFRQTERERETDRQTDRQTDRERERERETGKRWRNSKFTSLLTNLPPSVYECIIPY